MEMRLNPIMADPASQIRRNLIFVVLAFLLITLLAARSIDRFLRFFLPSAIALFILLPSLILFDEYSGFVLFMSFLLSVLNYLIWIMFSVALMENYTGSFLTYPLAGVFFYINIFSLIGPVLSRFIPSGTEFTVLISGIAAILFFFLSFRIIIPKKQTVSALPLENGVSLEDIFHEHGLSKREVEVSNLLVKEGLGSKEIAEKLFISPATVKDHIAQVYRKFGVKRQREFMALFVRG
jgi:DNA-binding CsgD family transcriptional regulator